MTATTIRVQMAQRKDTAANWTAANPILLSGEIGYETNTKKFKIGDGTTNWNSLAYLPIPDGSGNLTITGNLEIGTTGSLTFEGSTANGFETTLAVTDPTADRTITLPNVSGTVVTTGDTGSVTSTMIADGTIVNADISGSAEIAVSKLANGTANQVIVTDGTNVSWSDNLTLAGDLTVNGTTTTINTQDLLVEDKNIIIGNVATPSDVTADGGGITLKGATDKTINWVDATDAWTSSERFSYPLGSATAPSLTFTGDPNTGIYSPGADQVAISSNGLQRLLIDSSGNVNIDSNTLYVDATNNRVGLGISNPSSLFHLSGTDGTPAIFERTSVTGTFIALKDSASQTFIGNTNGVFSIQTPGSGYSDKLVVTSAGLVGIGDNAPGTYDVRAAKLVLGDSTSDGIGVKGRKDSLDRWYVGYNSSDHLEINQIRNNQLVFKANNTEYARLTSDGKLLVGTSTANGTARLQARNTGTTATDGSLALVSSAAAGGDAPNSPYAVTRTVYGNACTSGGTETIRTLASREIAFIKIFYSWPSGSPEWKTGAYDWNGTTVSATWFHESNAGHVFTLGESGGLLTLTQSVGVTMNMVLEIEYMDSSGLD